MEALCTISAHWIIGYWHQVFMTPSWIRSIQLVVMLHKWNAAESTIWIQFMQFNTILSRSSWGIFWNVTQDHFLSLFSSTSRWLLLQVLLKTHINENPATPGGDLLWLATESNLGRRQTDGNICWGIQGYSGRNTAKLWQRPNFCRSKKQILIEVETWGGCTAVGKESLIEQTNE